MEEAAVKEAVEEAVEEALTTLLAVDLLTRTHTHTYIYMYRTHHISKRIETSLHISHKVVQYSV